MVKELYESLYGRRKTPVSTATMLIRIRLAQVQILPWEWETKNILSDPLPRH